MERSKVYRLVWSGVCLALGMVLPFLTAQVPQVGSKLLPMHLPVLICGFLCGWPYGLAVGLITPLLRSVIFGMPPLFPTATAMAFEMAAYGALTGFLYRKVFKGSTVNIYISLVLAMLGGRAVWGLVTWILYSILGNTFTWQIFMAGAFVNAIPGIILQLVLVPVVVMALRKAKVMA